MRTRFSIAVLALSAATPARARTQEMLRPFLDVEDAALRFRRSRVTAEQTAVPGADVTAPLFGSTMGTGCFLVQITVGTQEFLVDLDTGSADLLIPGPSLLGYVGPVYVPPFNPVSTAIIGTTFADGSAWSGQFYNDTIQIAGMTTYSVFGLIESQVGHAEVGTESDAAEKSARKVVDGISSQGVLGIAPDAASDATLLPLSPPYTLLSSLVSTHATIRDRVSFRACPVTSPPSQSYVDWGGSNASLSMSGTAEPIGWARVVPPARLFSVNVTRVAVAGVDVTLPDLWQGDPVAAPSMVDSCTTLLLLHEVVFEALCEAVRGSGVLQEIMGAEQVEMWLSKGKGLNIVSNRFLIGAFREVLQFVQNATHPLDVSRLPNITIEMESPSPGATVAITLRGRDYVLNDLGRSWFAVASVPTANVVLGSVVFDSLYVVFDRENGTVGFGPGCGYVAGSKEAADAVVVTKLGAYQVD
ncbi:hypothetical protein HK101_009191, partial [Irineochytrium annulatum]